MTGPLVIVAMAVAPCAIVVGGRRWTELRARRRRRAAMSASTAESVSG